MTCCYHGTEVIDAVFHDGSTVRGTAIVCEYRYCLRGFNAQTYRSYFDV